MNWTSTQHPGWVEQCRQFATEDEPFRLDHVCGSKEEEACEQLASEHNLKLVKRGSSMLFTPLPN
jgi:hypothetical protein